MRMWDDILNKALLGSEKAPLTPADIPFDIADEFEVTNSVDKQEDFLKISALAFQFRQCGARASNYTSIIQSEAPDEVNPYCSLKANSILIELLQEDLFHLFRFWLQLCVSKHQLAHPETVPSLLDIANQEKELLKLITEVIGKRGEWLCKFNPEWNFYSADADPSVVWGTGEPEERKEILRRVREEDPDQARKLLEATWATEGTNDKLAFLGILSINLSSSDLSWLEGLKEKGQKVNGAIVDLLKSIPSSRIIGEYQSVLANAVTIKTGTALLGMIRKTELVIDESVAIPESLFRAGVEKLSSDKNVSDIQYILIQLTASVPPSFWNQHLQRSSDEIVDLIQKEKETALFLPALAIASARFNDVEWIKTLLENADKDIISSSVATLIDALPGHDRNRYATKFLAGQADDIIKVMAGSNNEWSFDLAKETLKHTAREVYQYNRQFYRSVIPLIPIAIAKELDSFTPDDDQRKPYWKNQRDELERLLTIKEQILQSFKA